MNQPRAAAIYARISSDTEGTRAGVQRQLEDCRALAEKLGWSVASEYVDNDLSAYSGKRRPEYERMLADLTDGLIDGVLVYHIDRLTRRPIELEHFLTAADQAKMRHVRFVTGDTDLNTGDGLLIARMLAAVAANESASKSRRVQRKLVQVAQEGRPHGGSTRPFGYAEDKTTIIEEEASVYRELIARFLAGEAPHSLTKWLNAAAVPTVTGAGWLSTTVRGMLANPRYAGLRTHQGHVIGPAIWQPIITENEHRRVLARMAEKRGTGRRVPQRYLLSGLLRCGKCGNRLYSSARKSTRRYVCMSGPDHGGCGGTTITADPVERLIADAVLYRLDTPELANTVAGRSSADDRTRDLTAALDETTEQLEELTDAYAHRNITMREWLQAKKPITQRQESIQRQLAQLTQSHALMGLVGNGEELGRTWGTLNLTRQNAIVATILDHAVIGPGKPGAQLMDPDRVSVVWRL